MGDLVKRDQAAPTATVGGDIEMAPLPALRVRRASGRGIQLFTHITAHNYRLICIDCGRTLGRHAFAGWSPFKDGDQSLWRPCAQVTDPPTFVPADNWDDGPITRLWKQLRRNR